MIKPGSRWKSRVCEAEVVLVRPGKNDGQLQCGGFDMVPIAEDAEAMEIEAGMDAGCMAGKRYRSEKSGIEILCTKSGRGSLCFEGEILALVETKKLPSSD